MPIRISFMPFSLILNTSSRFNGSVRNFCQLVQNKCKCVFRRKLPPVPGINCHLPLNSIPYVINSKAATLSQYLMAHFLPPLVAEISGIGHGPQKPLNPGGPWISPASKKCNTGRSWAMFFMRVEWYNTERPHQSLAYPSPGESCE